MDEKQYANIMKAIAYNANDREFTALDFLMRSLREISIDEGEEDCDACKGCYNCTGEVSQE